MELTNRYTNTNSICFNVQSSQNNLGQTFLVKSLQSNFTAFAEVSNRIKHYNQDELATHKWGRLQQLLEIHDSNGKIKMLKLLP